MAARQIVVELVFARGAVVRVGACVGGCRHAAREYAGTGCFLGILIRAEDSYYAVDERVLMR